MTDHVRLIDIDAITPHPSNPKAHDLDSLAASIARFGFVEPVVVDQRTGLNVSGHGRVKALTVLRDSGADAPDGITVRKGAWLAPVFVGWSSADDTEAEAALIALNRVGESGGWDHDALLTLLERLQGVDGGLAGVGYGAADIDALRGRLSEIDPPGEFPGFDDDLDTDYACPKCGYEWSGAST